MFQLQHRTPVWINANPSFKRFDRRLIKSLAQQQPVAYWEYQQHLDEASSINIALELLENYLAADSEPVDLIGHGTGGLLGLLYARLYPGRVKSLCLLSVGANPARDWQVLYYQMRKLLPCSQEILLSRLVRMMFGAQDRHSTLKLVKILQQDLLTSPSSHSLYRTYQAQAAGVSMPLMICGSQDDGIVDPVALNRWSALMKQDDVMYLNPAGNHFSHYFFPEATARRILDFWQNVTQPIPQKVCLEAK